MTASLLPASAIASSSCTADAMLGPLHLAFDMSGAVFLPNDEVLLVADLHLAKGHALARRGMYLPPHETAETLARLAHAIARFNPRHVVCLGDSFHSEEAAGELEPAAKAELARLALGRDWTWITGNHDPRAGAPRFGTLAGEITLGGVVLRHEPQFASDELEIAGHLHPCARIVQRGRSLRRRCFALSACHLVLPAFGALTGSLNLRDPAFQGFMKGSGIAAWMIGRDAVHRVPVSRLLPG
jgi:uncharacterized protein